MKLTLLYYGLFSVIGVRVLCCNLTAITDCTDELSSQSGVDLTTDGISAIQDPEKLRILCSNRYDYNTCYDSVAINCKTNTLFSLSFGTIQRTVDFMCGDGYKDILRFETCWNKTAVTAGKENCLRRLTFMITVLQQQTKTLPKSDVQARWCQVLKKTSQCMSSTVLSQCGEGPACIMGTMMDRSLSGLADLMKCPAPTACVMPTETIDEGQNVTMPTDRPGTTTDVVEEIQNTTMADDSDVTVVEAVSNATIEDESVTNATMVGTGTDDATATGKVTVTNGDVTKVSDTSWSTTATEATPGGGADTCFRSRDKVTFVLLSLLVTIVRP